MVFCSKTEYCLERENVTLMILCFKKKSRPQDHSFQISRICISSEKQKFQRLTCHPQIKWRWFLAAVEVSSFTKAIVGTVGRKDTARRYAQHYAAPWLWSTHLNRNILAAVTWKTAYQGEVRRTRQALYGLASLPSRHNNCISVL